MIEATCPACGTVNRIAEADVPVGAKFVSCSSCKAKVALPAKAASAPAPAKPSVPKPPPISIPSMPKLPTPAKGVPTPAKPPSVPAPAAKGVAELADLPAPKRQGPLASAEAPPKPAPRAALGGAELPVPKTTGAKPPVPQAGSLDLDDLMSADAPVSAGLADLPAPKPRTSALADLPAPKAAPRSALADLPAPKRPTPAAGLPPKDGIADLPAPKRPTPAVGLPPKDLADLPAPKGPTPAVGLPPKDLADLPAPKAPMGLTDLPMPKGPANGGLELDDVLDLPMPKAGITDLPAPKGITDLPAPKLGGNADLPAPKGFFDDLPQPAKKGGGTIDLPAPKGFFEDLPQPAKSKSPTQDVAPKGFFDDLPQPAKPPTQDVAPKGFFDDLPQPAKPPTQDVAPKGFFDDLPQPNKSAPAPAGGSLFDDLPQPNKSAAAPAGAGLFDDLPQPNKSAADSALGAGDIDLGPASAGPGLELDTDGPQLDGGGPELDLGLPLGEGAAFQDLDLSAPTPKPQPVEDGSPIKIKTPKGGAPAKPIPINVPSKGGDKGGDLKLDLAEDPHDPAHTGKPAVGGPAAQKLAPKKKPVAPSETPEARAAKRKRSRLVLGSLLGVVALGGGGFYFYQKHAAAQERAAEVDRQVKAAEKAIKSDDPKHWQRAKAAADEAIKLDGANAKALGLAAEAAIAGALDTGINQDARIAQGRALIQDALGGGHTSPELERAQAVAAVAVKGQAPRAIDLLKAQIAKAPKDGWLQLYLGWAQLANGDAAEAVKALEQASALTPATKLPALYAHGQAKLMLADVAGAKTDFETILQTAKDHVCAQVGLIATMPTAQSVQKVAELEAVLQRKDIDAQDPRCVVHAKTLIGDVHRAAGRLDMARQRYRDALKLVQNDLPTLDGLAAVELRDGKLQFAGELIQKALAFNPDHAESQLLKAELDVRQGKLPDAEAALGKLADRKPPLPPLAQAHLLVVKGQLLEAKGQDEDAVAAYTEGAKLAGDLDLTPTMAAVRKLSDLAKKAADPAKAAEYRNRADQLLQTLAERAQEDAQLSTQLGGAYLQSGDPVKAETFLRRAVALKGDDPEAKLQLAKALNVQAKYDDAIAQLKEAQQLDPKRSDIALELALAYQAASRHDEAIAAFDKLLALPDVPIIVRVNAGRYYASRGMIEKAAAQAEPILKEEPENPGGLYLEAEGLMKAGKADEATLLLIKATDADPDAQYLDALGRSYEARWVKSEDGKYIDSAQHAYERATKADPKMFHPWLGLGSMLVANKSWDAAIVPLKAASDLDKTNSTVMFQMGVAYYGLRNSKPEYKKVSAQWLEAALKARPELDLAARADASHLLGELYRDLNKPQDNVRAWENAIRLGEDVEKQTGKTPEWLTETYYDLGDLFERLANFPAQKRMFERYIARNPKDQTRKNAAQQAVWTRLKQY